MSSAGSRYWFGLGPGCREWVLMAPSPDGLRTILRRPRAVQESSPRDQATATRQEQVGRESTTRGFRNDPPEPGQAIVSISDELSATKRIECRLAVLHLVSPAVLLTSREPALQPGSLELPRHEFDSGRVPCCRLFPGPWGTAGAGREPPRRGANPEGSARPIPAGLSSIPGHALSCAAGHADHLPGCRFRESHR